MFTIKWCLNSVYKTQEFVWQQTRPILAHSDFEDVEENVHTDCGENIVFALLLFFIDNCFCDKSGVLGFCARSHEVVDCVHWTSVHLTTKKHLWNYLNRCAIMMVSPRTLLSASMFFFVVNFVNNFVFLMVLARYWCVYCFETVIRQWIDSLPRMRTVFFDRCTAMLCFTFDIQSSFTAGSWIPAYAKRYEHLCGSSVWYITNNIPIITHNIPIREVILFSCKSW